MNNKNIVVLEEIKGINFAGQYVNTQICIDLRDDTEFRNRVAYTSATPDKANMIMGCKLYD